MKLAAKVVGILLIFLVLFVFGFTWRDIQHGRIPSGDAVRSLVGLSSDAKKAANSTAVFRQAFDHIRKGYFKKLDSKNLKYAALIGMVASLGDPHTQFLEPKVNQEFKIETEGKFAGVGARLSPDPLGARVVVLFESGPAERAGLRKEDLITAVDGKSVSGWAIDDIVKNIRGKEGTFVSLSVIRTGVDKPVTVRIRREQVIAPTVDAKVLPGTRIGYASITLFSQPTGEQFDRALSKLENQGMRGLIIDLRSNPGGLLDSAVEMLSLFVENKVVVKMRGRDGDEAVEKTPSGYSHKAKYPIVTLIDEGSASAAEIFAGVLRDYRMTTLVGTHSYGKASVQNVIPMVDGASVKVTIAKYFLPGGEDISRKVDEDGQYISGGLDPDVKVELDWNKTPVQGDPKSDSQLQKAIEVLKDKLGAVLFDGHSDRISVTRSAKKQRNE